MKPVFIFRHVASEGPGYFAEFLQQREIPYQIVAIDAKNSLPASARTAAGLVFMGGPMSANDALPWIAEELQLIQQAADQGIPLLGHCLGGQLISRALGGQVQTNPVKEIGWHPVARVSSSGWLQDLPLTFPAFHWHGETFTLPAKAQSILSSHHCKQQGFVLPKIIALQCHIEMTAAMVETWVKEGAEELSQSSPGVQTPTEILSNLDSRIRQLQKVADIFYTEWIGYLKR